MDSGYYIYKTCPTCFWVAGFGDYYRTHLSKLLKRNTSPIICDKCSSIVIVLFVPLSPEEEHAKVASWKVSITNHKCGNHYSGCTDKGLSEYLMTHHQIHGKNDIEWWLDNV